jgi:hypothetical protein
VSSETDDPLLKLRYIEKDPAAWDLSMTLPRLGRSHRSYGLVPLARSVQQVTDRRILGVIAYGAATLAIGGAVSWVIISSVRIAQSPLEVVFADASLDREPSPPFPDAPVLFGLEPVAET